jgi:hypothetical protein
VFLFHLSHFGKQIATIGIVDIVTKVRDDVMNRD